MKAISKIIIGTIIILLAIAAEFAYLHFKPEVKTQKQGVILQDKKIVDNTKPFKIDITYPYIEGQDGFNSKIKIIIDQQLADFKKTSLENNAARKATMPAGATEQPMEFAFNLTYQKGRINNNVAAIMLDTYSFEGGAHGGETFVPVNYDLKNQKLLSLDDLFAGNKDYLQKVAAFCEKDLIAQIKKASEGHEDADWIKRGTEPIGDNYSVYLDNGNTVVIYFSQYQVAPYAFGSFRVIVPKNI